MAFGIQDFDIVRTQVKKKNPGFKSALILLFYKGKFDLVYSFSKIIE